MASNYNMAFNGLSDIQIPKKIDNSTHVYHQYTLKVVASLRDKLMSYLNKNNIPTMIYYPLPLYKQEAFSKYVNKDYYLNNTEELCDTVLSLPVHTEIETSNQDYIIEKILNFFR